MPPFAYVTPDGELHLGLTIGVTFLFTAQADVDLTGASIVLQTIGSDAVDLTSEGGEITISGNPSLLTVTMPAEATTALAPSRNPFIFMAALTSGETIALAAGDLEVSAI